MLKFVIFLFLSIGLLTWPWWLSVLLIISVAFYWSHFWYLPLLGLLTDLVYGPFWLAVPLLGTLTAVLLLLAIDWLRRSVILYN